MKRDYAHKNCPLKLLREHIHKTRSSIRIEDINKTVQSYFALPERERPALRQTLFFELKPFLLKLLSRYCGLSAGCGVNCHVAELVSGTYITFTDLLDKFDSERQVNFLGYIVNGLSWGTFNRHVKHRRYAAQHILCGRADVSCGGIEDYPAGVGGETISGMEAEELLGSLGTADRDLVLLHHVFGYSCEELAGLEKIKPKTIQKKIERARNKMSDFYRLHYHKEELPDCLFKPESTPSLVKSERREGEAFS